MLIQYSAKTAVSTETQSSLLEVFLLCEIKKE